MLEDFLVVIAKDVGHVGSLTEHWRRPDLIVTSNRVDFPGVNGSVHSFTNGDSDLLPLLNTNLQMLLASKEYIPPWLNGNTPAGFREQNERFREAFIARVGQEGRRRRVVINTYLNSGSLDWLRKAGHIIMGPTPNVASILDSKIKSYEMVRELGVPVLEGGVAENIGDVERVYDLLNKDGRGIFFGPDDDGGGTNAHHIKDRASLASLAVAFPVLVTGWVQKTDSPSSQVLIGENGILYLGCTDQILDKDGFRYKGNSYPSQATPDAQAEIREHTLTIASEMQKRGYRGFAGVDWVVEHNTVYYGEINPRKTRGLATLAGALELDRPENIPSLTELELQASLGQEWQATRAGLAVPEGVYFATQLIKHPGEVKITQDLIPEYTDRTMFLDREGGESRSAVLNAPQEGAILRRYARPHDLARIIAVGPSHDAVHALLQREERRVHSSYRNL